MDLLKMLLCGAWEFLYPLQSSLKKHTTQQCYEHDLGEGTSVVAGSNLPGKKHFKDVKSERMWKSTFLSGASKTPF